MRNRERERERERERYCAKIDDWVVMMNFQLVAD